MYPDEYIEIVNKLEKKKKENIVYLKRLILDIQSKLRKNRISAIVGIEMKNVYSVYKKMQKYQNNIDEINDLFNIKVIVRNRKNCYISMGIVNNYYQVIPGTFKDYIASPRDNMYEALQSILINDDGIIFEIHICSYEMNRISKYGILAFFSYINENKLVTDNVYFKDKFLGIKNSIELEKEINNPKIFLNTLKTELYEEEIYVFSEKGELVILPKGATVLDFIFKMNVEMDKNFVASKVNYINMPVVTELKDGDIVEIYKSSNELLIDMDWLNMVKTAKAKSELLKIINECNDGSEKCKYLNVEIYAKDRRNLILDIMNKLKGSNINILSLKTELIGDNIVKIFIILEKYPNSALDKILSELKVEIPILNINLKKCNKKLISFKTSY